MTTQQAELERVTAEKEALETENTSLTQSIETLTSTNEELASTNRHYVTKSKFMDAYVVFVENDGTGYYHKYGCDYFAQTSFWAYSRSSPRPTATPPARIASADSQRAFLPRLTGYGRGSGMKRGTYERSGAD